MRKQSFQSNSIIAFSQKRSKSVLSYAWLCVARALPLIPRYHYRKLRAYMPMPASMRFHENTFSSLSGPNSLNLFYKRFHFEFEIIASAVICTLFTAFTDFPKSSNTMLKEYPVNFRFQLQRIQWKGNRSLFNEYERKLLIDNEFSIQLMHVLLYASVCSNHSMMKLQFFSGFRVRINW